MLKNYLLISILIFSLEACSKKEKVDYEPKDKNNPYTLYKEGLEAFEKNDYYYAEKKFSEAELNFKIIEHAAKSAVMASYALYGINFYSDALNNLERYLKKYPADKNVQYAHYLIAIIHYEQIADEKKDLKPLIDADKKINFYLKKYPDSDYAIDLKFKKDYFNQGHFKEDTPRLKRNTDPFVNTPRMRRNIDSFVIPRFKEHDYIELDKNYFLTKNT